MSEVPKVPQNPKEVGNRNLSMAEKLLDNTVPIHEALGVPLFALDDVWKKARGTAMREIHPDTSTTTHEDAKTALERLNKAINVDKKQVIFGEEVIEARANVLRTVDVMANNPEFVEADVARRITELRKGGASKAEVKAALEQMRDVYSSVIGLTALKKEGVTEGFAVTHTNSEGKQRKMLVLEEAVKAKANLMNILNNELNRVPKPPETKKKPVPENPYNDLVKEMRRQAVYGDIYEEMASSDLTDRLRRQARESGSGSLSEMLTGKKKKK